LHDAPAGPDRPARGAFHPGRVAIQLRNRGIPLDVRRPRFGDDLPKTLADHSGVVIFGGPQSANDDDEIVKREIDWIGVPLKEKKPFLGICLGAQMLAKRLGARVYKHADGHAEVGYYPIRPTAEGRAVCKDWPDHVYQWHREGLRPAGPGGDAGGGRFVSGPGLQLRRHRLCAAIPHGRHPRHDVPLDHPRP
jgi:GMP synthase (glutamine-hydrolysing)